MPAPVRDNIFAYDLNVPFGGIFKEAKPKSVWRLTGLSQYILRVTPDKMGCIAVVVDYTNIAAVRCRGEHSCQAAAVGVTPSMQENKSRSVRVEQQMIEVMLSTFLVVGDMT